MNVFPLLLASQKDLERSGVERIDDSLNRKTAAQVDFPYGRYYRFRHLAKRCLGIGVGTVVVLAHVCCVEQELVVVGSEEDYFFRQTDRMRNPDLIHHVAIPDGTIIEQAGRRYIGEENTASSNTCQYFCKDGVTDYTGIDSHRIHWYTVNGNRSYSRLYDALPPAG
jgi:hypothetical protein